MIKYLHQRSFILMIYFVSISQIASAQKIENPIHRLKEGTLLVRLDMKAAKQEAYQEIIESANNQEKRTIYEEKLKVLKEERAAYLKHVLKAFEAHYIFSEVLFIKGQDFKNVLEGTERQVIDSQNNLVDLPNDYLVLIKGNDDTHWKLVDKDLSALSGVPDNFDVGGFKKLLDVLVGAENYSLDNMRKVVQKIEKKISKYYEKEARG